MKCCVDSCGLTGTNYPPTFLPNQERVTFYEFPGPDVLWLRKSWLSMIGISECRLPQDAVVCSQHFKPDDFFVYKTGTVQLRRNSVPSVFKGSHSNISTFKYCVICLDTGANRLYVLNKNRLAYAFTNVTGLSVSDLRDSINTVPKLCPECAQRLTNCDAFKDKMMRANTVLHQLLQKHTIITAQDLKSINRWANTLTSNLVKHTFTPNHCDLHLVHNEENDNIQHEDDIMCNSEDNIDVKSEKSDEINTFTPDHCDLHLVHNEENDNIQPEGDIMCNSENNIDVKSEKSDEIMYEPNNNATDYEIEYLSELDVTFNKDMNEIQNFNAHVTKNIDENTIKLEINDIDINDDRIHNDNIKKDCKTNNVCKNISELELYDNSNIINPDSIAADIKGEAMLNCDVDSDVEFLDNYRDRHYDSDIYDDDNDIDEDIAHDDRDFDFDINDDINELLDDDGKNIYKELSGGNTSENKVSLNNVIFVKDPRPIIQHKDSISSIDATNLYNHLKIVNPSSSSISLYASTTGHSGHMTNEQAMQKKITRRNQTAIPNNDNIEHNEEIDNQYENNIVMNERKCYVVLNRGDIPPSMLKDIQDGKIVTQIETESNKDLNKSRKEVELNSTKIDAVNERLGVLGKRIRFSDQDPPRKYDPNPNTQDCIQEDLKSFTMICLSHEEQIAEVLKRKDTEEYQRADFKCETCYKGFWQPFAYQRHLDMHTTKLGQFSCGICGIHAKRKWQLRNHIARFHSHRYNCKQCDFTTTHKSAAVNHQRWHSGYKYVCDVCGVEYERESTLFSHMRLKHPSDYACALCGYSFVSPLGVRVHIKLKHRFEDTQNLSGPLCEECDIRFASDAAYQQHLQVSPKHAAVGERKPNNPEIRHGPPQRRYPHKPSANYALCELCGKRFPSAGRVRQHIMLVHNRLKAHECEICHKRFSQRYGYKTHMVVHHSDNPPKYTCGVCHKELSNVYSRKKHMECHQESRQLYKCDLCEKLFTSACGRNLHVSHVHHNVPWPKRHRPNTYKAKTRSQSGDDSDSQEIGANETITAVDSLSEALEYEECENSL